MTSELEQWRGKAPNDARAAKLRLLAWMVSAVVLVLVGVMQRVRLPMPDGWSTDFLPPFHAAVNGCAAIVLLVALAAIKAGRVALHRRAIFVAMGLSVLFLLSYVAYHMTNDPTRFGGVGTARTIYFALLISHIVLAGISLPFILFTFISGWTNQFERHKRMARWVFPMWLYVAVTGPVCYWMLRPYY
jgi:putative membrane protein